MIVRHPLRDHVSVAQYDFVFVQIGDPKVVFELKIPMPSQTFSDRKQTLEEAGIANQTVLIAAVLD